MEEIAIEYTPSLDEHLHADRVDYRRGLLSKVDRILAILLVAFGAALLVMIGPRWWCFLPFPVAVIEWFDLLSLRPIQIRVHFARNPRLKERYRLVFGDQDIHFTTPTVDSRLAWTHYHDVLESDRVFMLVFGKRLYTVIPKRAFKEAAELSRFRDLAKRKIGSSGRF
jgi:hypothetical protein